jgi:hypothetical protein
MQSGHVATIPVEREHAETGNDVNSNTEITQESLRNFFDRVIDWHIGLRRQ